MNKHDHILNGGLNMKIKQARPHTGIKNFFLKKEVIMTETDD